MPPRASLSRPSATNSQRIDATPSSTDPRVLSLPSSVPASLPPQEDARQTGVFVLINGLLCRTADSTGQFNPGDVFGGVAHGPACPRLPVPSLRPEDGPNTFLRDAAVAETGIDGFDSDCPIFDTFGVMTGGVLIDPFNETFADYTQPTPYTVAGIQPAIHSSTDVQSEAYQQEVAAVHVANELAFRRGLFSDIRPTSALTLCTSELALPPPAPELSSSAADHVQGVKRTSGGRYATSRHRRRFLSAWAVNEWHARLAIPRDVTPSEAKKHREAWNEAEGFRLQLVHNSVSRALQMPSTLRPGVPFLYREGGVPVSSAMGGSPDKEAGEVHQADPSMDNANGDGNAIRVPRNGVRSAASSFVCYSGMPILGVQGQKTLRETMTDQVGPSLQVRLQKRLRPYGDAEPAATALKHTSTQVASVVPAAAEDQLDVDVSEAVKQDVHEYFLTPYRADRPRSAAFYLFCVYFNHFGLLCNGVRLTGETVKTSASRRLRGAHCVWGLCAAATYDVEAEVSRKRQVTRALWSGTAKTFPGGSRRSTTASNKKVVSAAFNALMVSNRDALLRRILLLSDHLHNLTGKPPEPL